MEPGYDETINRIAEDLRNQIVEYFEGRLTAIENQILTSRRFHATVDIISHYHYLSNFLQGHITRLTSPPNAGTGITQPLTAALECRRYIDSRIRLAMRDIEASSTPEQTDTQIKLE